MLAGTGASVGLSHVAVGWCVDGQSNGASVSEPDDRLEPCITQKWHRRCLARVLTLFNADGKCQSLVQRGCPLHCDSRKGYCL